MQSSGKITGIVIVAASLALCGAASFYNWQLTPGAPPNTSGTWPNHSQLARSEHRSQLLMFIHPRCGCTRSSVEVLAELLAQIPDAVRPDVSFVILKPGGSDQGWSNTPLEQLCRSVPDAVVVYDVDAYECRTFGITTSGTCLLVSDQGRELFCGGLNAVRGHRGPSPGAAALRESLLTSRRFPASFPVFGCAMTPLQISRKNPDSGFSQQHKHQVQL